MRKSQTKTLADVAAVALQISRASLSELGRLPAEKRTGAAKHSIKRVWRFTANDRVHVGDAMQGPLRWLFQNRKLWKNHPLLVTFDWTKVRSFHTLMAAAVKDRDECWFLMTDLSYSVKRLTELYGRRMAQSFGQRKDDCSDGPPRERDV